MVTSPTARWLKAIGTAVGIAFFLFWSLAPIYWIVVTSLKPDQEIYAMVPTCIPAAPTLANYDKALFASPFPLFVRNSGLVAAGVTLLSIVVAALAAYAIARQKFKGKAISAPFRWSWTRRRASTGRRGCRRCAGW